MTPEARALVAMLGVQLQLAASLLCFGLGLALLRDAGKRPWFASWVWSFAAVAAAVGALFVRYVLLPPVPVAELAGLDAAAVFALYAAYLLAKLLFYWLIFQGAWQYARGASPPAGPRALALLAAGAMLFPLVLSPTGNLAPFMVPQAIVAVAVFAISGALVLRAPAARLTRGGRVVGMIFLALAGLWVLYIPAFLGVGGPLEPLFGRLTAHNSYIDTLFEFFLGFGALLALLDDVTRDRIGERTARLRQVAASEERLAQIIRSASEGIVLLDGARRVAHLNPAALEILECESGEAIGEPFDRFLSPSDRAALWAGPGPGRHAAAAAVPRLELTGLRAGGESFPLEISLAELGEGPAEGYVLVLRDTTEGARLREERERMQLQLEQSARMQTIGRMISGVAHELNNPLAAILAFAQDLLPEARSGADREALTTIVQQAQRCRAIVQDLVTFARARKEEREPMAAAELLARVRPAFERQAGQQGARLRVEVGSDLPLLEVNPAAMEQVLTNLLGNALDAVEAEGGEVTLRASVSGNRILLAVEDNGPGIPPEVMPRLFEPFFTTKPPGKGTGLGLSVSQSIVEQHGGTLRAASPVAGGRGACFTVALPFVERRGNLRRPVPPAPEVPAPPPAVRPRRVLVIDDEAAIRVAIRRFLERRGWIVEEAGDGQEALDLLELDAVGPGTRGARYDAVVTDLRMPGVSGIVLHDRLASEAPDVLEKLIVVSGDTASPEVAEFLHRLRRPLVQKPFDLRTLADLLDEVVPPQPAPLPPA